MTSLSSYMNLLCTDSPQPTESVCKIAFHPPNESVCCLNLQNDDAKLFLLLRRCGWTISIYFFFVVFSEGL